MKNDLSVYYCYVVCGHRRMVSVQGDGRMNAFLWGIVVGWFSHAVWVFMIRPIIREAMKNE
jgi:hypothetical protein